MSNKIDQNRKGMLGYITGIIITAGYGQNRNKWTVGEMGSQ